MVAGLSLPNWFQSPGRPGAIDEKKSQDPQLHQPLFSPLGSPGHLDTLGHEGRMPRTTFAASFRPISHQRARGCRSASISRAWPGSWTRLRSSAASITAPAASHENGQRWMMTGHDFDASNKQPHYRFDHLENSTTGSRGRYPPPRSCSRDGANRPIRARTTPHGPQGERLSRQGAQSTLFFPRQAIPSRVRFQGGRSRRPPPGNRNSVWEARRKLLHGNRPTCSGRWKTSSTLGARHGLCARLQPS